MKHTVLMLEKIRVDAPMLPDTTHRLLMTRKQNMNAAKLVYTKDLVSRIDLETLSQTERCRLTNCNCGCPYRQPKVNGNIAPSMIWCYQSYLHSDEQYPTCISGIYLNQSCQVLSNDILCSRLSASVNSPLRASSLWTYPGSNSLFAVNSSPMW